MHQLKIPLLLSRKTAPVVFVRIAIVNEPSKPFNSLISINKATKLVLMLQNY